ncbi:MAG: phage holin family protein [Steroidobacteraceae bacterium]
MRGPAIGSGRAIADVLVDIGRNAQDLLRAEIRLAQSEVREQLIGAQSTVVLVVVGVAGAVLSGFFLLLAALFALRFVMPAWAAALCVTAVLSMVSAVALTVGVRRLKASRPVLKPLEASVKEDAAWDRQATR